MNNQTIIFPFSIYDNEYSSFAFAMDLAKKINARLKLVTSVNDGILNYNHIGENDSETAQKNEIYNHLLELKGKYQSFYNGWSQPIEVVHDIKVSDKPIMHELCSEFDREENSLFLFNEGCPLLPHRTIQSSLGLFNKCMILPIDFHYPSTINQQISSMSLFENSLAQINVFGNFDLSYMIKRTENRFYKLKTLIGQFF